jgi:hypothetical protein
LLSLLSNALLYLLALPMRSAQVQLFFRLTLEKDSLDITIASQGFEVNTQLQEAILQWQSLYADIVNFPQLLNFYALQKISWRLKSKFEIIFLGIDKQRISINIPLCSRD